MIKIAIHQSQYIPWPPYFRKIALADIFVLMDNVQFQKNGVQNRNQIRNKESAFWLTVPVTGHLTDLISNKKIANGSWREKHWKSIKNSYEKSPFWKLYSCGLEELYNKEYSTLGEANDAFFNLFARFLNIKTKIVRLSSLKTQDVKSDLVLAICKMLNASVYISGLGGKGYLKEDVFEQNNVCIEYLDSIAPVYPQFHGEFIEGLSIIDMMFNVGPEVLTKYLMNQDCEACYLSCANTKVVKENYKE